MKCTEAQQRLSEYWDLKEDDEERAAVDSHLTHCAACREEFEIWEASRRLIQDSSVHAETFGSLEGMNRNVMERIYASTSLMSVPTKSYKFTKAFKRNISIVIAACMAMFACALFVFVFDGKDAEQPVKLSELSGLMETANASTAGAVVKASLYAEIPVASISDPVVLEVVPAFPHYYIALSLIGLILCLLVLNWLARTRN
ncbi:zf-HC2 domain-containing protein [Paenibacillus sp. J5C_2022]|uniref:anti-sigma factor family protein n=1 Tax=Paenibacillus sp. J5C2022 TaxID=2977129 RepID=UPI0021CE3563|nr:zf-HC2 domain-containing protein [Paenibacillus sp. J5C2022]MCU6708341.1 zf-HC2 domain-containing protein [Paenibacillus sp. J5C2022]